MKPFAAQPPRVPRSRRDDRYDPGHPTPFKRPSAGWVQSVQADNDTCTVIILDEVITGVVPLHGMPTPGAIVEVEARGDLLCILQWYEHPLPPEETGGSVIIPMTAVDYYFRIGNGTDTNTTDHFVSSAQFGGPGGITYNQTPQINANSSWGSSVHTDDDTGYSTMDNVGFDAAVEAAFKPPSGQYYLTTIGAMTTAAAIPADAVQVRWRAITRVRNSAASTLEGAVYFGSPSPYDGIALSGGIPVTTAFTRYVSGWFEGRLPASRLTALKAGKSEMTLRARGPNGTFDVAYMAIEVEWDWDVTP
jgi:hypothetical protein